MKNRKGGEREGKVDTTHIIDRTGDRATTTATIITTITTTTAIITAFIRCHKITVPLL